MTPAELRAQVEALEWALYLPVGDGDIYVKMRARIAELRAQADATPEVEPVAWIAFGGEGEVFNNHYEAALNSTDSMRPVPLYAQPDQTARIAELEGLLREVDQTLFALVESNCGLNWTWPDTARETSLRRMKDHRERIEAALGEKP